MELIVRHMDIMRLKKYLLILRWIFYWLDEYWKILKWQKGIKELKESKGEITDEDPIETYQDYRNSFKDLYESNRR